VLCDKSVQRSVTYRGDNVLGGTLQYGVEHITYRKGTNKCPYLIAQCTVMDYLKEHGSSIRRYQRGT
jgi:hypothetical protein